MISLPTWLFVVILIAAAPVALILSIGVLYLVFLLLIYPIILLINKTFLGE